MGNRLDRQISGSTDQLVERLVQALEQQGLTVTEPATGDDIDVRMLTVTDVAASHNAVDVDPDGASVGTVSISVREVDDGVRFSLIDPVATATLTDEADLLGPAQHLHDQVAAALDGLANDAAQQQNSEPGEASVRRTLLDAIEQTATGLAELETQARADTLFVLAKAYTAIVSLERTEEVELHLA